MSNKKGFIIMEIGYEYNDEYYHTGNYGATYEAPTKVFINKEKALEEMQSKNIEKLKGEDLGRYNGDGLDGICNDGMQDKLIEIFKKEFNKDISDDYEIEVPKTATNKQVSQILECLRIEFFELVEVDLETE